jgi:hypothetical protein
MFQPKVKLEFVRRYCHPDKGWEVLVDIGISILVIGYLCNVTVMLANGWAMPVSASSDQIDGTINVNQIRHFSSLEQPAKIKALSDIMTIEIPIPPDIVIVNHYSIGDILIILGGLGAGFAGIPLALKWEKKHGFLRKKDKFNV